MVEVIIPVHGTGYQLRSTDTSKPLTCSCLTHWGHSCMRVLIILEGKKIFVYLKRFPLIINVFLKI